MTQDKYVAAEFPDDLVAIQELRLVNSVFNEICEDLELMGRDLTLFSKEERLRNRGEDLDVQESYQALREELGEFLRGRGNASGGQ